MLEAFSFDWQMAGANLLRMLFAFGLAFPLAAAASCGYMLIALHMPASNAETIMRALQGLLGGMSFIGGGAILKSGGSVRGLATAASLWSTGAIGAAVAFRRQEIAILLALANFALLRWLKPLKQAQQED